MSATPILHAAFLGFAASLAIGAATWIASLVKRDVSIVDSAWSLMIVAPCALYAIALPGKTALSIALVALAGIWALRLCTYITWRHRGEPEDRRYQAIRARNQPGFAWKSAYLVFGLQAVLAWIVSLPLLAILAKPPTLGGALLVGTALAIFGIAYETVADAQLARFRTMRRSTEEVMDRGLWRYSRHPNYFGEFCVWWGFYLAALAAGGEWTIASPLLMSVLLLRVSGVTLLESDLRGRKPAYRAYVARTNAFFPGPRRDTR